MDAQEFILLDTHKVRRDSNLMHLYLELFKETFGTVPSCAGCSFSTDWQKLVLFYSKNNLTLPLKEKPMKTIEIKKKQGNILTYRKEGKNYRLYDTNLNDNFINEFLTHGTQEELEARKKMFNFPKEHTFEINTSKVDDKLDEVSKKINSDSTEKEIEEAIKEVVDVIEIKTINTPKKRGRKAKK